MGLLFSLACACSLLGCANGGSDSGRLGLLAKLDPGELLLAASVLGELLLLLLLLDVLDLGLSDFNLSSTRVIFVGRDVVSSCRSLGCLSLFLCLTLQLFLLLLLLLLLQLLVLLLLGCVLFEEGA